MVNFHGWANELAADRQPALDGVAVAPTPKLPCPLEHENGTLDGRPSLSYRLWQLLQSAAPSGSRASDLAAATDTTLDAVQTALESSRYFVQVPGELHQANAA